MKKITRVFLYVLVLALAGCVPGIVYGAQYRDMLDALPMPPEGENQWTSVAPLTSSSGDRHYFSGRYFTETVNFIVAEYPKAGWSLVDAEGNPMDPTGKSPIDLATMLFTQGKFWLCVGIAGDSYSVRHPPLTMVDNFIGRYKRDVDKPCITRQSPNHPAPWPLDSRFH